MPMNRHHDSQRSDRLVTQPSRPTPPPPPPQHNSLYHKQLTAPAERLVRALAHAVGMRAATLRPRCSGRRPVTLHNTLPVFTDAQEVQNDTQRTARARGVSPGEPGESHAARC